MSNPAPAKKGIDSVLKLLEASGDLSVVIYKAQKAARKADGSLDVSLLGQAIAGQWPFGKHIQLPVLHDAHSYLLAVGVGVGQLPG